MFPQQERITPSELIFTDSSNICLGAYFDLSWFAKLTNTTTSIAYGQLYTPVLATAMWGIEHLEEL